VIVDALQSIAKKIQHVVGAFEQRHLEPDFKQTPEEANLFLPFS